MSGSSRFEVRLPHSAAAPSAPSVFDRSSSSRFGQSFLPASVRRSSSSASLGLSAAGVPSSLDASGGQQSGNGIQQVIRATANKISQKLRPIRARQKLKGDLSESDRKVANLDSYVDDYVLRGTQPGQLVEVTLRGGFSGYLQLLNARTGREVLYGDDNFGLNRLVFAAKPGTKYAIRVSSLRSNATGNYTLRTRSTSFPAGDFNFFSGYGLVNAAAAVAQAKGAALFADVPNLGGDHWDLDLINAPEVWAQGITGQGVTVAVIDSGVDYNHPDLQGSIWTNPNEIPGNGIDDDGNGYIDDIRGWNFVFNNNDPFDDANDGHGTHVSGTIAALRNDFGPTGVAYDAKIMPIKVLNRRSIVDSDALLGEAIRYAVNNGAKIINMSLGGEPDSGVDPELEEALKFARESGVLVVFASGNERQDLGALKPGDPAFFAAARNWALPVGGVDFNRVMYRDSNPAGFSPIDFVVAPGVNVTSTIPNADYATYEGTSMAAPHVAGVAALMLSANPTLTPDQLEAILTATADRQTITLFP